MWPSAGCAARAAISENWRAVRMRNQPVKSITSNPNPPSNAATVNAKRLELLVISACCARWRLMACSIKLSRVAITSAFCCAAACVFCCVYVSVPVYWHGLSNTLPAKLGSPSYGGI